MGITYFYDGLLLITCFCFPCGKLFYICKFLVKRLQMLEFSRYLFKKYKGKSGKFPLCFT